MITLFTVTRLQVTSWIQTPPCVAASFSHCLSVRSPTDAIECSVCWCVAAVGSAKHWTGLWASCDGLGKKSERCGELAKARAAGDADGLRPADVGWRGAGREGIS